MIQIFFAEEESRSSATGELDPSIRNVLITASDDLGPMGQSLQQQTTDQNGKCLVAIVKHVTVMVLKI